ncbi:hypothetical protein N658DRAFT_482821 [Parathielavia hyrcaniae]|uniref:Zn(2)-C6 fungal-type domain-containing protein n=1 Tax=Parathielavia hyrcaniae TaxID=113614 RepID=A0AAN6Q7Z6_9PEZI|nr:hypothetical protein N658DRAFT_482821 [Parathielavia hyrcaniae]
MSYQYPPPPQDGDMDIPQSGYLTGYSASSDLDPDSSIPFREHLELKRSISTPMAGSSQSQGLPSQPPTPQQSSAAAQDSAAERRRNKLGYHRTSVACGHCRRRKIRCIPSPNDVQGRCINCIRLKKECSFFPVDQQPPVDTRQKSGSRSSVGPQVSSSSSPPAMQAGLPSDGHAQQSYPHLAMPTMQNMAPPMKSSGSDSYSTDSKMSSSAYGQHGVTNWMSADASPSSSKPGDMSASWRSYPADSPITTAFSPYTPHAPQPSATWSASVGSESSAKDDIAWSPYSGPTPRSMSFGAESMAGHQPYPSMSQVGAHSSRGYDRKSSSVSTDMYSPAVATTIPGIETVPGTTLDQNVSLSAGAVPPVSYTSWQQPYSYSKPGEGYGGWYGDAGDQHSPGHGHSYYGR